MNKARFFWPILGTLVLADARFWTFNVADVGVSIGAILLAMVLWREDNPAEETA